MSMFDEEPDAPLHGECAAEISRLNAQIAKLQTHPCLIEGGEFDHNWKFTDDSFDHEYGTERVYYWECRNCNATKDVGGVEDVTVDRGP